MGRIKTVKQADNSITLEKLQQEVFDSIYVENSKEPNGVNYDEFVIYSNERIKEMIICV